MNSPGGHRYWRSLEELANTPEFQQRLQREFPALASEWSDPVSRRHFLKLMSASIALAGLTACTRQPLERIVPYVVQPENIVPGVPLYYATAMTLSGYALGLLVRSNDGRPTKIEGNPEHPISMGATNAFAQASILDLYDPDRAQAITQAGEISSWGNFLGALNGALESQQKKAGAGIRFLTGTVTSPTLASQLQQVLKKFPEARWHQYEAINRDGELLATRDLFGEALQAHYAFDKAEVIVSLESDFLFSHPAALRYARDFTNARRVAAGRTTMNRLYVAESSPSITGSMADHRLPIASSRIELLARGVAAELGLIEGPANNSLGLDADSMAWARAAAKELQAHRGKVVVIAGDQQPASVHALAHLLNSRLGNVGSTVSYTVPVPAKAVSQLNSFRDLVHDVQGGKVELLAIFGGNPVFTAPVDLEFASALGRVPMVVYLSGYPDETAAHCHWHLPEAHFLESWSDARAYDGTASIVQPLIEPLFGGRSVHQVVDCFLQQPPRSDYELVREYWRTQGPWPDFEKGWRKAVHDGVVAGTRFPPVAVDLKESFKASQGSGTAAKGLELSFRPDPSVWDGRFANNAWLQELPKPITTITWDNAAYISHDLASKLGLRNGDVAELRTGKQSLRAPVWILPGQGRETVTVTIGYGRSRCGRVGKGVGFNAFALQTTSAIEAGALNVELRKTTDHWALAVTQPHHTLAGRDHFRGATLEKFRANPRFAESREEPKPDETLYNLTAAQSGGNAWGMVIDLNTCIGCNACVTACQAENNVPVVGKDQVLRSREMHWLRIDSYFSGAVANPQINYQPVLCMHCETAPCELVCPVEAAVHDSEGLNLQVYNRCVGTRYCSNNCPYKVRRFNFLQYADQKSPTLKLLWNPEVTVRTRGVMEKCTYCVQRISSGRIAADKENRSVREGEVRTACQQACPVDAIVFGNLRDPSSKVVQLKKHPLNYGMLAELNTRPRTTYLAKLRNPNPSFEGKKTPTA